MVAKKDSYRWNVLTKENLTYIKGPHVGQDSVGKNL